MPLVLTQLCSTNHLLRYLTPAVIPLAIGVGVLADRTGWTRSWALIATSSVLFSIQLLMIVYPVVFPNQHQVDLGFVNGGLPWRVMPRFDQWDWEPLRDVSYSCGLDSPKISYLGGGRAFGPPQMQYPWVEHPTSPDHDVTLDYPEVTWLWRYEDTAIDWQKVMDAAGQSDIVLTAPHYVGEARFKEDVDNQHNAEFVARLLQDSRFRGPIRMDLGRFEPVEIDVFLKKSLPCHPAQESLAGR